MNRDFKHTRPNGSVITRKFQSVFHTCGKGSRLIGQQADLITNEDFCRCIVRNKNCTDLQVGQNEKVELSH